MTPYHEPRTFTPAFTWVLVLTAAGMVWIFVTGERVSLRAELIAAGIGVSLLLFYFWFGTSRWGSEFKTITVDERGLTVGPRTLPPGTKDDAVVVEDLSADRPSVWLIASRDPETLDAALQRIRSR